MAAATKPTTPTALTYITNYYKILLEEKPDTTAQANEAKRVDAGDTTLAKVLLDLYQAPGRLAGHANEWAEAFFVLTGRAPDYATFTQGMDLLTSGMRFADLMEMVLKIPGHFLSTSGIASNAEFINTLYSRLTNGLKLPAAEAALFARLLDTGSYTRGEALASALESAAPALHGGRESAVQRSLIFLAAASKEASNVDLLAASGDLAADILQAMEAAGISIPAGYPYFIRSDPTSDQLALKGELTGDLVANFAADTFLLAGKSAFKTYYSVDGGIDAAIINFGPLISQHVSALDAGGATGKGKLFATGTGNDIAYRFVAPAAGSTLQGAGNDDTLVGGAGIDKLIATDGFDTLSGGAEVDTFVFAQAAYYRAGSALTNISDFGNGADVLDFSRLLGAAAPSAAKIAPILATSTAAVKLANGGVALIENDGVWVDASGAVSQSAAKSDIAALFGAGAVFQNPVATSRHVLLTADLTNGADIWLINNDTTVNQITEAEIFLVGHIDGDWNLTLNGLLPIVK